jgi:hypothetical protein
MMLTIIDYPVYLSFVLRNSAEISAVVMNFVQHAQLVRALAMDILGAVS